MLSDFGAHWKSLHEGEFFFSLLLSFSGRSRCEIFIFVLLPASTPEEFHVVRTERRQSEARSKVVRYLA